MCNEATTVDNLHELRAEKQLMFDLGFPKKGKEAENQDSGSKMELLRGANKANTRLYKRLKIIPWLYFLDLEIITFPS